MKTIFYKLFNIERMSKKVGVQGKLPSAELIVKTTIMVALPSITESFLIAIVSFVDSFMVSGLGDYAISAVGLTNQPKFILLAVFIAMSQSVSALTARRRGEGRLNEASKVLRHALTISLALSVILSVIGVVFANELMHLMRSKPDTHQAAVEYFRVIAGGMTFNVITMIINAAQRGVGNTKIAMKTNIVANLVNVVLNFLLIEGRFGFPRLEVRGAAIATVIGTMCACVMAILSVTRPYSVVNILKGFTLKMERTVLKSISRLSLPAFGEQIVVRIGFALYFIIVADLGTIANAAHNIGMNFINISFSVADGLSVAAIALVGRSLGEKRQDLAKIYSSVCQRFGLMASCLIALIYVPFGKALYSLFSDSAEVLNYGYQIMTIISVIIFIQISMIIFSSSLRAAGDVKYMAVVSLVCIGVIRPLSAYLLCYTFGFGLIGAWMGMLIDQTTRFILSFLRYRKGKWLTIKI